MENINDNQQSIIRCCLNCKCGGGWNYCSNPLSPKYAEDDDRENNRRGILPNDSCNEFKTK